MRQCITHESGAVRWAEELSIVWIALKDLSQPVENLTRSFIGTFAHCVASPSPTFPAHNEMWGSTPRDKSGGRQSPTFRSSISYARDQRFET